MAGMGMDPLGQASEDALRMDISFKIIHKCWNLCMDPNMPKEKLSDGSFYVTENMHKCRTRCVGRHYEVMGLMEKMMGKMGGKMAGKMAGRLGSGFRM